MKKIVVLALCLLAFNAMGVTPHLRLLLPNPCTFTHVTGDGHTQPTGVELEVFPNPTSDSFTLYVKSDELLGLFTVHLYNVLGIPVWKQNYYTASGQWRKVWDMSHVSAGIYFLSVHRGQEVNTVKIVVRP